MSDISKNQDSTFCNYACKPLSIKEYRHNAIKVNSLTGRKFRSFRASVQILSKGAVNSVHLTTHVASGMVFEGG